MAKKPEELAQKLGYTFTDATFFNNALTHRSVSKTNNERLEFLGDALLSYIIAQELYHKFPEATEGDLSRLRSNLVKGETLSKIARKFHLGEYLNLGVGELRSGGFNRSSILADALEAIIGAIYLDSNIDSCRECVLSWYQSHFEDPNLFYRLKDPKTRLQEYCQARQLPLPEYKIKKVEGEQHAQVFTVICTVVGVPRESVCSDTTRRKAEQKAADELITWLENEND